MQSYSLIFTITAILFSASISAGEKCVTLEVGDSEIVKFFSQPSEVCVRFQSRDGESVAATLTVEQEGRKVSYEHVQHRCVITTRIGRSVIAAENVRQLKAQACYTVHAISLTPPPI